MEKYKLTYFNLRGIGEPIRMLFKYTNVPFEEIQVDVNNWFDVKKDFKWQQLPYLEYNGKILTQSATIGNFLARKFKLVPEDLWGQAKCDEVIGALYDLRQWFEPMITEKFLGNTKRVEEIQQEISETVSLFLTNLNELLQEVKMRNEGQSTDLILGGAKPTWADLCLATFNEMWASALDDPNLLEDYQFLKKQQIAVYSLPGVAEWIATRPTTFV